MNHIAKKLLIQCIWLIVAGSGALAASPCDGVDRSLTKDRMATLAPAIAKQLKYERVDVLQSFRDGNWQIIYVDTHESDETFLFYAHNPMKSRSITSWSGAATIYDGQTIKKWVLKNAPGIPPKLASCFAWHVTKDRDK